MNDNDALAFQEETDTTRTGERSGDAWKILIVDDDSEVHAVTKLALDGFSFAGRGLEFLCAYSGEQARGITRDYPDIAVMLLDVVMEEDNAGLAVARYVREELGNPFVRIILRTGQPGQAPERQVVQDYDINDYKEKTELTAQKLFTSIYTALGTYRALLSLDQNRRGLIKVINASATILEQRSLEQLAQGTLEQVAALLYLEQDVLYVRNLGVSSDSRENRQVILAATGEDKQYIGQDPRGVLSEDVNQRIQRVLREKRNLQEENYFAGYLSTRTGTDAVIYVASESTLTIPDQGLIELFFRNVTIGLENLQLRQDIEATQKDILYILGDAVETRSGETAHHVHRVAEYARELALLAGMEQQQAEILYSAAPLHDIGKIGVPDSILNNPGHLDEQEWELMKSHALHGARILGSSKRPILQAASIIAEQHHENWDGTGYPAGRSGEQIHIFGRIVALGDVFDALGSDRCYKLPWELNRVIGYLREQRGRKFDPVLLDLFIDNLQRFIEIRNRLPDRELAAW